MSYLSPVFSTFADTELKAMAARSVECGAYEDALNVLQELTKRARIDTNRAMWRARLEEIEASIKEAQDRRLSAWTKHERALIQHWEHIIEQREEDRDRHLDRDTATYSGE